MGSKLWQGDCLELMKNIPDGSVDMILCDLPYGTTKCKWDIIIPFDKLWNQYKRLIKSNGAIVLFGSEPFSSSLRVSALDIYRYDWIWESNRAPNFVFGNKQPLKKHEIISVFYAKQPTYNAQKTQNPKGPEKRWLYKSSATTTGIDVNPNAPEFAKAGKNYEADKLLPKSVIYFAKEHKPIHPTQKPIALIEYLVNTYTNENETVLDNCMGSGSTGVACANTNRNFIGIEMNETYFNIAKNRIEEAGVSDGQ